MLAGIKTATCWAAIDGAFTHIGKRTVVLSGSGRPLAVIETIELTQQPFNEVDEALAYDESEGDQTLAYWREAHRRYFTRLGQFSEDMLPYCERFRIVERIDEAAEAPTISRARAADATVGGISNLPENLMVVGVAHDRDSDLRFWAPSAT